MIKKYVVSFNVDVELEIDESKFDNDFMEEFKQGFHEFNTIEEHITYLAELNLRGICDNRDFIEGYGETEEMGINFKRIDFIDEEIEEITE